MDSSSELYFIYLSIIDSIVAYKLISSISILASSTVFSSDLFLPDSVRLVLTFFNPGQVF